MDLHPGLRLALWPRQSIAHDSGLPVSAKSPTELTLGHNVSSKAEVDTVMGEAKNAGAVTEACARILHHANQQRSHAQGVSECDAPHSQLLDRREAKRRKANGSTCGG
jgi:hypothetical protein